MTGISTHPGILMSSDHITDAERREKLWSRVKDIKTALFTTRHPNGHLHSRPMTLQNRDMDESESLWFFMSKQGDPVADLRQSAEVNVGFADAGSDAYVSVSGRAEIVEDLAKKQAFWNKAAEAWFKGGVTDPDLALVRVRITHASYWDVKSSKLMQLYAMAKAAVTGEPPKDLGETGKVRM